MDYKGQSCVSATVLVPGKSLDLTVVSSATGVLVNCVNELQTDVTVELDERSSFFKEIKYSL